MVTPEDVKVEIIETIYPESGRRHFSVKSTYGAHTFINSADSREEAERMGESHRQQMVQLYTPQHTAEKRKTVKKSEQSDFQIESEIDEQIVSE